MIGSFAFCILCDWLYMCRLVQTERDQSNALLLATQNTVLSSVDYARSEISAALRGFLQLLEHVLAQKNGADAKPDLPSFRAATEWWSVPPSASDIVQCGYELKDPQVAASVDAWAAASAESLESQARLAATTAAAAIAAVAAVSTDNAEEKKAPAAEQVRLLSGCWLKLASCL